MEITVLNTKLNREHLKRKQYSSPNNTNNKFVFQPESRPISQEQVGPEVKVIYAGSAMVEAKCIEYEDEATQLKGDSQLQLNDGEWQAIIALHRNLLHEHHDFFLASQHRSATAASNKLAVGYATSTRMHWHELYSFSDKSWYSLFTSIDHTMTSTRLSDPTITLLHESLSTYNDSQYEHSGNPSLYDIVMLLAPHWDSLRPRGLKHHLVIPAWPEARHSLPHCPTSEMSSVKAPCFLLTSKDSQTFEAGRKKFLGSFLQISPATRESTEHGSHIAVANSIAVLGLASDDLLRLSDLLLNEARTWTPQLSTAYKQLAYKLSCLPKVVVSSSESKPWALKRILARFMRALQSHRKSLTSLVLVSQLQNTTAMPTGASSMEKGSSLWTTLGLAVVLGSILAGIMHFPKWRDTSRLLVPSLFMNIGCYIIGADGRVSTADLAVTWLFAAGLNIALLKDKLRRYLRTGGLMALFIAILGTLTAIGSACTVSFPEGERYSNPLVFVAIGMLPGTLLWEIVWLVLVQLVVPGNGVHEVEDPRVHHSRLLGEQPRTPLRGSFQMQELDVSRNNDYRFHFQDNV
jgi:hypothetical protein